MQQAANSVIGFVEATFLIAVLGAVTGVASLTWNLASYRLTGARIKVDVLGGWLGSGSQAGRKRLVPWHQFDPRNPPTSELMDPVVVVVVTNKGRLACSVTGWSVVVGADDYSISISSDALYGTVAPIDEPHHFRLEGHAKESRTINFRLVDGVSFALTLQGTPANKLTAVVSLGNGRTERAKPVPLKPAIIVDPPTGEPTP